MQSEPKVRQIPTCETIKQSRLLAISGQMELESIIVKQIATIANTHTVESECMKL